MSSWQHVASFDCCCPEDSHMERKKIEPYMIERKSCHMCLKVYPHQPFYLVGILANTVIFEHVHVYFIWKRQSRLTFQNLFSWSLSMKILDEIKAFKSLCSFPMIHGWGIYWLITSTFWHITALGCSASAAGRSGGDWHWTHSPCCWCSATGPNRDEFVAPKQEEVQQPSRWPRCCE